MKSSRLFGLGGLGLLAELLGLFALDVDSLAEFGDLGDLGDLGLFKDEFLLAGVKLDEVEVFGFLLPSAAIENLLQVALIQRTWLRAITR